MSLATRLIVLLIVPFALCVGALGMSTVELRRALMMSEAEREIRDDGTALQLALDAVLRDRAPGALAHFAENLSSADRIWGVLFFGDEHDLDEASRSVEQFREELSPLAQRVRHTSRPEVRLYRLNGLPTYAHAFAVGRTETNEKPSGVAVILRDLSYIDENLADFERHVVLVAVGLTAVLTLSIWILVKKAVGRPLSALSDGVERVASGDLTVSTPVQSADEIGRLTTAFNEMTVSLRRAAVELEMKQAANLALERRLQHAQRLALIGQLTASIAHQIGSPLNVILGRAQYALKLGGQCDRDRRHFQEIVMGAERVSRVIEQFLSQARKARGPAVAVDIGRVVCETVEFLAAECDRYGITASVTSDPALFVEGRRDEVEQVILNLCLNAIQAQPEGGCLSLEARRIPTLAGDSVQVEVTDAGPGVNMELREVIFEPFFTTKADGRGTGLGLAICEEMVRRQGGTIHVSNAPGGGALFRITLPGYGRGADNSASEAS